LDSTLSSHLPVSFTSECNYIDWIKFCKVLIVKRSLTIMKN
jgi:hypothetical protein